MASSSSPQPFIGLKLRGKRRKAAFPPDSDAPRRPGRPLKRASELVASRKKAKLQLQMQSQSTAPNKTAMELRKQKSILSPLERLPVELVLQIFLYCLEVNMVKASPFIGKMLSNDAIYTLLMLFAFFDDDGVHPVETNYFKPATYRRLPINEKMQLQISILDCRWCTLTRVKDCLPILCSLRMTQEWHKNYIAEEPLRTAPQPLRWTRSCITEPKLPALDDKEALLNYFYAKVKPRRPYPECDSPDGYLPRIRTYIAGIKKNGKAYKTRNIFGPDALPTILAVRHIPPRLLAGAWTEEDLKFFYLLRQGHRWLQSDLILSLSPEILFAGMKTAIHQPNPSALLALLELYCSTFRLDTPIPTQPSRLPSEFRVPRGHPLRPDTRESAIETPIPLSLPGQFGLPTSQPLPLSLLHAACTHAESIASSLLALLIRGGVDSIPKDDPILTRWAVRASYASSPVATWLLKHMEGTQEYALAGKGRNPPLFVNGALGSSLRDKGYPFSSESFTAEIGYEHMGGLAFIPQAWDA